MASPLYDIAVDDIDGKRTTLKPWEGKVLLIVNVASKCGLTPQYEALESVYENYRDQGLVVLGFPSNDFAGQEPGTEEEIKSFCETNFNVQFPMFGKVHANGPDRHPLYASLIQAGPEATPKDGGQLRERLGAKNLLPPSKTDITWNFEKFLVDRKGTVVGRFDPDVTPDDPKLTKAIEAALAA
jgi:glutathione peroxidase